MAVQQENVVDGSHGEIRLIPQKDTRQSSDEKIKQGNLQPFAEFKRRIFHIQKLRDYKRIQR